jgi:hypothetical protein
LVVLAKKQSAGASSDVDLDMIALEAESDAVSRLCVCCLAGLARVIVQRERASARGNALTGGGAAVTKHEQQKKPPHTIKNRRSA